MTTNPSPVKCQVSVSTPQGAISSAGGVGTLTVSTSAECAWTATSNVTWIALTPASGQGGATVQFNVAANPGPSLRQGHITVNEVIANVTQAGSPCQLALTPAAQTMSSAGGTGTVAVSTPSGCSWTAASNDSWLTITSGSSGTGDGTVGFSATANQGADRVGSLTIGGQSLVVTQPAPGLPPCQTSLQPSAVNVSDTGGTVSVGVTATAGCAWTALSQDGWITITGPASGVGNGTVTIVVDANTGGARTGTLTIAGITLTVTQSAPAGCSYSINPTSLSVVSDASTAPPISVVATAGCAWTATSNDSWITIAGPASGVGDGTVTITVDANTGGARTGTVTIAGITLTVTQSAPSGCSYSIDPTSLSVAYDASTSPPISVLTTAGCAWTAASNDSWITIASGASGAGPGTVTFSVTRNNGNSARTGTLTIAGLTFTVMQARK